MKQLMDSNEQSEAFLTNERDTSEIPCCFPLIRTIFPKQPLTNEELECLVLEESDKGSEDRWPANQNLMSMEKVCEQGTDL